MNTSIKDLHVAAAIIIHDSKILIAKRAPQKSLAGFWEFPGGKIESGETGEECLKREILEELGIEIIVDSFFMSNRHQYGQTSIALHAYFCQLITFDIKLIDHDEIKWLEKNEMINIEFAPADVKIVEELISNINSGRI